MIANPHLATEARFPHWSFKFLTEWDDQDENL